MSDLEQVTRPLRVDADLVIRLGRHEGRLRGTDRRLVLEIPDAAAGWKFLRFGLPRGLRGGLARHGGRWLRRFGLLLEVNVGGRPVLLVGGDSSWLPRLLGWRHVRIRSGNALRALARRS